MTSEMGFTMKVDMNKVKHETFYVRKGKTRMVVNDEQCVKQTGDVLVVPTGTKHNFTGTGPCSSRYQCLLCQETASSLTEE